LPAPSFEQVFPLGAPDYQNIGKGNGLSGASAAIGWASESTLDIEWAYAIAPLAHIVLLATPPAETLGVQGLPNLHRAVHRAVDPDPAGTVFSQSFGSPEQDFGGAAPAQTAKFDRVFQAANAKGDSVIGISHDSGSSGPQKQARESRLYPFPVAWWPGSSP